MSSIDWRKPVQRSRANNKMIRTLITYVKDDLDSIDCEMTSAGKKHIKPRENIVNDYIENIEFLLKGIKNEFKFKKET